jgi:hypothetical protein
VDLVSGTPIYDIKPYITYSDSIPEALSGPFHERPGFKKVRWSVDNGRLDVDLRTLIEKVIGLDPRPGFSQSEEFGVSVSGWNIRFREEEEVLVIFEVTKDQP